MNTDNIQAIFFDLGATLRILHPDPPYQEKAIARMAELAGTDMEPHAFVDFIDSRYEPYRKEIFQTNREATEAELWSKWLMYDAPDMQRIIDNAVELSLQYRMAKGHRFVVEHGVEVIQELHRRGYTLGIISNLITSQEVPDWLEEDGLTKYFSCVLLSAVIKLRKPDPAIYLYACDQIGVPPEQCASVADNLKRDFTGAKAAGIGINVLFISPEKYEQKKDTITDANRPDCMIHDFLELLDMFPGVSKVNPAAFRRL